MLDGDKNTAVRRVIIIRSRQDLLVEEKNETISLRDLVILTKYLDAIIIGQKILATRLSSKPFRNALNLFVNWIN